MSIRMASNIDMNDDDEYDPECTTKKTMRLKIDKTKILMKIKFAQAAQIQGNYKLALAKLKDTNKAVMNNNHHLSDLQPIWNHCYLFTHLAKSKMSNNSDENLNTFFNSSILREIVKFDNCPELKRDKELQQEHEFLHSQFCQFLIKSFVDLANSKNDFNSFYSHLLLEEKKRNQLRDYVRSQDITRIENVNLF
jgi:hypothetical protein